MEVLDLKYVESAAWGGLSLTFIISAFAILFCFPIGVILALGRRSSLPAIKYISIGFIELWRGVPLNYSFIYVSCNVSYVFTRWNFY